MSDFAKIIEAIAYLTLAATAAAAFAYLVGPVRSLIRSGHNRKMRINVAGVEMTFEEVNRQQQTLIGDLQKKIGEL